MEVWERVLVMVIRLENGGIVMVMEFGSVEYCWGWERNWILGCGSYVEMVEWLEMVMVGGVGVLFMLCKV